jgi:dTDP-4-dehydrorhamnose reductase
VEIESKVIPVITGANGTLSKSLRRYLNNIPGKQEITEVQKNNHIGHCMSTVDSAIVHGTSTKHISWAI